MALPRSRRDHAECSAILGLNVYPDTLRCEVKGMKGPLAEDPHERARAFVKEFVSTIAPK